MNDVLPHYFSERLKHHRKCLFIRLINETTYLHGDGFLQQVFPWKGIGFNYHFHFTNYCGKDREVDELCLSGFQLLHKTKKYNFILNTIDKQSKGKYDKGNLTDYREEIV